MNQFNHTYHRRPRHRGLINGAVWSAHDRVEADNGVGTTRNHNSSRTTTGDAP